MITYTYSKSLRVHLFYLDKDGWEVWNEKGNRIRFAKTFSEAQKAFEEECNINRGTR